MRKTYSILSRICLVALCLALSAACATKKVVKPVPEKIEGLADLRDFPQNLQEYAKQYPAKPLLGRESQEEQTAAFASIYFGPWSMTRTTARKKDVTPFFRKARGYKDGAVRWRQEEWDAMLANANLSNFPTRATPGITLRKTDLRELPTHTPRFSEPTPDIKTNPFDYFQYSVLWPGMPLLIAHTTLDGRWHYIECPIATGWVDANDIAIADQAFQSEYKTGKYAALIKEDVVLPGTGFAGKDSKTGIGTVLPLALAGTKGNINALVPVANSKGYAEAAEIPLTTQDATVMPMPITPGNVAQVGNNMMGQPYGWGGTTGTRDCSAMMRDLFTPFGIWLPRNSAVQAKRGQAISLKGMTAQEKARTIMADGIPFLSLLGLPGHIGLYVGAWHGQPAMFHNAWGLRIIKDGNDNERYVIGKAVVTSIEPGKELENLYRTVTFVDRLRSLTRLGGRR